mmetsp:Transcript_52522/g.96764  ORF Transcript_52522/g.96764 Transcript_52522/m.96764 type:complete len:1016 (-) Transcript_52522:56-3103(-)
MDAFWDIIFRLRGPVWMELMFIASYAFGFVFLRILSQRHSKFNQEKKVEVLNCRLHKALQQEAAAGHATAAVKAWRAVKDRAPTQLETLKFIVEAMLEVDPTAVAQEILGHMADHSKVLCNSRTAAAILEIAARTGQIDIVQELQKEFKDRFQINPCAQIFEALLSGYASAGNEKQVSEICLELHEGHVELGARAYSMMIKGFLKNGLLDAALKCILDMRDAGFAVPSFAIVQLLHAACDVERGTEMFQVLHRAVPMPPASMALMLEDCLRRNDLLEAREIEKVAREQAGASPLLLGSYDALLKVCILHSDLYALELFQEMQTKKVRISEGLCVGLLARCAETKFLRFAQEIAKFVRGRGGMSITVYSALMKVYAYAGMYGKACDLYDQITEQGMEPDSMMYGCLMKFSVECGRTDLSRELFSKAPSLDIQNYMSLIRAAGRDKDIDRAFQVLQKLKESNVTVDNAAYNCVLDVCVGVGDMSRARDLMAEMRRISKLDIITYNTFLKGFCSLGDIRGAKELLSEMESMGMHPNDVSFNCLINAAASRGMWHDAWSAIDMMERNGVPVDHYTISILMKALKKTKDSKQVNRALTLLDRAGLEVCSDEVLLNTVLETCIRHQQHQRLERVVDAFRRSSIQPSVHTYGSLIKACSNLKRADMCWELWRKMVDNRALEPNDIVLGCMLDALVCNQRIEEAVALFKTWQPTIPPNTIMYSTLIKGFANSRQPSKAMDMWREMQELKLPINNVVYNAIIDSQARMGLMDEVGYLVKAMEQHGCKPDGMTFSLIVKGYCFRGDLENAFQVLREIQGQQILQDSIIYNTFLDGCVRHNRMDLADKVLEDMEKFNVTPSNFTLGILVKMYGRRGQLDKAFEIVEDIPKRSGFKVNAQVKTCLMSACFYNHKLDSAFEVFEELRSSSEGADWKIYSSMVSGTLRHGLIDKAVAVVEEAYGLDSAATAKKLSGGKKLEMDCLEQLFRGLAQRGQMESVGVPLLNRFHAAQIPISGKLLSSFASMGA